MKDEKEQKRKRTWFDAFGKIFRGRIGEIPPGCDYCDNCVSSDAIVIGYKPETIKEFSSHRILSSGRLVNVERKTERKANTLLLLKGSGVLPLKVTPEHPIRVITLLNNDKNNRQFSSPHWKLAKDLIVHKDFLIIPKLRLYREYTLSSDMAKFLGIYLAEGYLITSKRKTCNSKYGRIILTFGRHEYELAKEIRSLCSSLFQRSCLIRENRTSLIVSFHHSKLAKYLEKNLGRKAISKFIPYPILFNSSKEIIRSFLLYYWKGDGYKDKRNRIHFITSSRFLTLELQLLLTKLGIWSTIHQRRSEGKMIIEGRTVNAHDCYDVSFSPSYNSLFGESFSGKGRGGNVVERPKYFAVALKKKETLISEIPVYNFTTSNSAFQVNNIQVHNCGKVYPREDLHYIIWLGNKQLILCEKCTDLPPSTWRNRFGYNREREQRE